MSDSQATNFGNFIPGFDFMQNLAKSSASAVPNVANWIAPTLSVEEIDKRINELKTVQFWLDQNARALAATVQALEVQKMTLATLKGMNVNFSEMASSFMPKSAGAKSGSTATGMDWPPERKNQPRQSRWPRRLKKRLKPPPQMLHWLAWWTRCTCGVRSPSNSSRSPPARWQKQAKWAPSPKPTRQALWTWVKTCSKAPPKKSPKWLPSRLPLKQRQKKRLRPPRSRAAIEK